MIGGLAALLGGALTPMAEADAGLTALTHADNDTIAADMIVVRVEGEIAAPMAQELRDIWSELGKGRSRLLLDLDSQGGSLRETEQILDVIAEVQRTARVDTLVRHDAMCASACVAIYVQGTNRYAGGSSTWLFHGACHAATNVPDLELTGRFLNILREAGVADDFLCALVEEGYVTTPGKFWISGYELVNVYHAHVITKLLEPWRSEAPYRPPRAPQIGPH